MKTLVIGASDNTERYSNLAVHRLVHYGHEVVAVGLHPGEIDGIPIQTGHPAINDIDTVSVYVNPLRQNDISDYILKLKPRRIIFNPGAENPDLENRATEQGIEVMEACTIVLLNTGQF